jgi:vacuolar-type H+-ATPase subunit E/Vma4
LQQQIDELKAKQEALQKQLEERQELMQNLFSFVESNLKK